MPLLLAQLVRTTSQDFQVFMRLDYFQCADQSIREGGAQLDQKQHSLYLTHRAQHVKKERSAPALKTLLYQNSLR